MIPGSLEPTRALPPAGVDSLFRRPAVFISTISPGFVGGGSQCALAFLQAISALHRGDVIYLGPPFIASHPAPQVALKERIDIQNRSSISKLAGVFRCRSVDRTTPAAFDFLDERKDQDAVVYVHGELAGNIVPRVRRQGLPCVFICQNYAPEYLRAETLRHQIWRRMYAALAGRAALVGYRDADVCVTLTDEDRRSYEAASGRRRPAETSMGRCYFGYQHASEDAAAESTPPPNPFTVLVNTNLALRQNEEGALFVLREVWPQIHASRPWRLILAGRHPTKAVFRRAAAFDSVEVISRPEPEDMERIFRRSSVCLASTFRGSGIKLRVAESLRRGIPVACSEHCSRGYEDISRDVLRVFHTAEELIGHLDDLSREAAGRLQERCREQYCRWLSFDAGLTKMAKIANLLPQHADCPGRRRQP
jgi:hypothetical protein